MPKYELAISVKNEIDHTFGKYRKKEGDIIAMRPYPWNWGRKEIDEYLIVIVECNLTFPEMKRRLKGQMYSGGHELNVTFRLLHPSEDKIYPKNFAISLPLGTAIPRPVCVGKRKYRIPLSKLGAIDKTKVQDKMYIYQPFKSETQLVKPFDGLNGNRFLHRSEVDCAAPGILPDEEKVFLWDNTVQLIQDKFSNSYIKP